MTVYLLDANVLIALVWPQHVHHSRAHQWFEQVGDKAWATCPLTQLAFVRISSNPKIIPTAVSPREALAVLTKITARAGHYFWTDALAPIHAGTLESLALVGHRQVTDAYLLALAQHHRGKLATFDKGISELLSKDRAKHVVVIGG